MKQLKNIPPFLIRSLAALVIGIILVIWPDVAVHYVVIAIGLFFFVLGATLIENHYRRPVEERGHFHIAALGSALLGLILMTCYLYFVLIMVYLIGVVLLLGGIHLAVSLMKAKQQLGISPLFFLLPALLIVAGIFVMAFTDTALKIPCIVLGISAIFYSLSDIFNYLAFTRKFPTPVEEVSAEEM